MLSICKFIIVHLYKVPIEGSLLFRQGSGAVPKVLLSLLLLFVLLLFHKVVFRVLCLKQTESRQGIYIVCSGHHCEKFIIKNVFATDLMAKVNKLSAAAPVDLHLQYHCIVIQSFSSQRINSQKRKLLDRTPNM